MSGRRFAASAVLVALVGWGITACGGDGGEDASPTTASESATPSVTPPPTAPVTPPTTVSERPCDAQTLLEIMQSQGAQFDLSPAVLGALTPVGPPNCDATFASLTFSGPPEDPGPFAALFGSTPGRPTWELSAVNCLASVASGQRRIC